MTDKELLEYAAKAAGNGANSWSNSHKCLFTTHGPYPNEYRKWNPLTDDGDALRLAVKLGFDINHWECQIYAGKRNRSVEQIYETDPYAATRRAIVRAAAKIGKQMKS